MRIPEKSFGTGLVLTGENGGFVEGERADDSDGTRHYRLTSTIGIGREAIGAIVAYPLGVDEPHWQHVRDGLKDLSYPSRSVQRLARAAKQANQLHEVKGAAGELANTLDHNQNYHATQARVPVFSYGEAAAHASSLIAEQDDGRFERLVKSYSGDMHIHDALRQLRERHRTSSREAQQLLAITGMSGDEQAEMTKRAIVESLDPRAYNDLVAWAFEGHLYTRFPEPPSYDGARLTSDKGVYVLSEDIPPNIQSDRATHIVVGTRLRDADKRRSLPRHAVEFHTQSPRHVAAPLLAWRVGPNGARAFEFPTSSHEHNSFTGVVIRPSSIAGAALFASARAAGIEYSQRLEKVFGNSRHMPWRRTSLSPSSAGLWPLVANYRQDELLEDDYIVHAERALDTAP